MVVPTNNKLIDFAIQKLNGLFDAVNHAIPTATKYVLEVTSYTCTINAILSLIPLVPFTVMFFIFLLQLYHRKGLIEQSEWRHSKNFSNQNGFHASWIFATTLFIMAAMSVISNLWAWIGIFHPDLYLVHQIIEKVS